jgi:hypothetical protein
MHISITIWGCSDQSLPQSINLAPPDILVFSKSEPQLSSLPIWYNGCQCDRKIAHYHWTQVFPSVYKIYIYIM